MSYDRYVSDVHRKFGANSRSETFIGRRGSGWPALPRREPFGRLARKSAIRQDQTFPAGPAAYPQPLPSQRRDSQLGPSRVDAETVAILGEGPVVELLSARTRAVGWKAEQVAIFSADGRGLADCCPPALKAASIVLVALPPSAHPALSVLLRDCLRPGALLVLIPGQPGGAGQLAAALATHGPAVTVGETSWSPWLIAGGRSWEVGPVPLATVPSCEVDQVSRRLEPVLKTIPVQDTRWTALHAPDVVLRTVPALLDQDHRQRTLRATLDDPMVSATITQLEEERGRIARALGLEIPSLALWLAERLDTKASSISAALGEFADVPLGGLFDSAGPSELVPYGLVPTLALAEQAGVDAPVVRRLIAMADDLLGNDFILGGRGEVLTEIGVRS